jgi:membrane protease YdiL (CAAX protease family)
MNNKIIKFLAGFLALFILYHGAEWFVLKSYYPSVFLLFQGCFFLVAFLLARWQGYKGLSSWALNPSPGWFLQWITGMILGIALYSISFYVAAVINDDMPLQLPATNTYLKPLLFFALGSFLSSLSEDILTRGYLFRHVRPKVPSGLFIAFSAIIYLLNHIYRLGEGWQTILYLLLLGILFAIPLIYSERLWYTAGMHWMGNLTFYFTHQVIQSHEGINSVSPNLVFILCILFILPLQYLLFPRLSYMKSRESIVIEALKNKPM